MEKLRNTLQRDKEVTQDTQSSPSTGRLTGQGSHLSKATSSAEGSTGGVLEQPTAHLSSPSTDTAGISSTSRETGDSIGSAAIGQTSTYSSHTLRHGDAVGSVIDHKSQDPTTYKMPEHTFGQGTSASGEKSSSGVPAGAAGTAASLAFNKHQDQSTPDIPGAFPRESAHDTATIPPVNRPIDYEAGRAAPDSNQSTGAAGPAGTSGVASEVPARTEAQTSGAFGRILGAVGLGGAATGAGLAASKSGDDRSQAVVDTPQQPTTTTGTDSYTAPTQSGPPPSHHRKESIPTTAYPAGPGSPSPIQAPVGGTKATPDETQRGTSSISPSGAGATSYTIGGPVESEDRSHTGRNAGLAAAGVGAGAGAAALGAHEYGKSRGATDATTSSALPGTAQTTSSSTVPGGGPGVASSSFPSTTQDTSGYGRDQPTGITGQSVGPTSQTSTTEREKESSGYGKAAAAAGLGAGAGALGAHEYGKHRGDTTGATTSSTLPGTQSATGSAIPSSSQAAASSTVPPVTQSTTSSGLPSTTGTRLQQDTTRNQPITSSGPTSQVSSTEQGDQYSVYGKTAAAAGLGAGAGAAGATALHHDRKHDSTQQFADKPWESSQAPTQTSTTTGTSLPVREKAATQTPVTSTRDNVATDPAKDDSHTARNAGLAGAAGAGAGAYGAHEYSKHQAEQDATRRQKNLAEQEAARQKQFEKDQKAADKLAHKEEKQHEKDLKKLEKAEGKSHEKELKKEEKQHHKELEKEEKERTKEEEAERKRREKEAAALAGTAGAGGAAYAAHHHDNDADKKGKLSSEHDHNKLHKNPPEEKKPNFFKRIFKRRKNKDTGDSEEYSTDEEDNTATGTHLGGAGAAGTGLAGTTGTAGTGTTHDVHDPTSTTGTHGPSGTTTGQGKDTRPIDDVTGLPFDPEKDPAAAQRLMAHDTLGHRILEKADVVADKKEEGHVPLS